MVGIAGASGLIGWNLYKFLEKRKVDIIATYFSTKKEGLINFDIGNNNFSLFDKCDQVVILNGITNIDNCFLKKDEACKVNVEKTIKLIKYISDRHIKPIFISSDQVFNGKKGNYTEEDIPAPINYYGKFKLQVEKFMRNSLCNYLILRLSKTYSRNLEDGSIFTEIFSRLKNGEKVKASYNQVFNPTDVEIVCDGIYKGTEMNLKGVYHLADERIMSRYDFALLIANEYGFDISLVEPVDLNIFPFIERRTLDSSLNVKKLRSIYNGSKRTRLHPRL